MHIPVAPTPLVPQTGKNQSEDSSADLPALPPPDQTEERYLDTAENADKNPVSSTNTIPIKEMDPEASVESAFDSLLEPYVNEFSDVEASPEHVTGESVTLPRESTPEPSDLAQEQEPAGSVPPELPSSAVLPRYVSKAPSQSPEFIPPADSSPFVSRLDQRLTEIFHVPQSPTVHEDSDDEPGSVIDLGSVDLSMHEYQSALKDAKERKLTVKQHGQLLPTREANFKVKALQHELLCALQKAAPVFDQRTFPRSEDYKKISKLVYKLFNPSSKYAYCANASLLGGQSSLRSFIAKGRAQKNSSGEASSSKTESRDSAGSARNASSSNSDTGAQPSSAPAGPSPEQPRSLAGRLGRHGQHKYKRGNRGGRFGPYKRAYPRGPASRGNRSSATVGQLARIWFAIPAHCHQEITVRPLVTPGRNAPTFRTTPEEFTLSSNSIWVLRFPFVYRDEQKTYLPPKESSEFIHFKVSKILSRNTAKG
ncbi:Oidioi.mRNA.OKI2018_I69.chr2.g7013.t1.cds [Oikopleura dioica]|uniref:Oidioi.mRNA.OKI2018_I69.chr2.g7013.t1.cds n=1 Tax=Oikopleura dioica TaxID=34765 RepID=A0ABN7T9M9_OIKDI|nr:Oidioi.mRNA.OKI2018_I69.chr2.g7013.t1.cds [Oikopleura dioica]